MSLLIQYSKISKNVICSHLLQLLFSKYSMHKVSVAMNMKLQVCVEYKCTTQSTVTQKDRFKSAPPFRGANSPTQQDPHNLWLTDWLIECSVLTLGLHHSCVYTLPVSASGHITKIKHWKLTRHKELPSIPNPSHLLVWGTFGSIRSTHLVVGWKIKHLSAHLGRKTERIYRFVQDMTLITHLLCLESSSRFWVVYLFKK